MIRKGTALLLLLVMALGLCACGSTAEPAAEPAAEPTAESTPEPTPVPGPEGDYAAAEGLLAQKDYDGAIAAFTALGDYSDAADRVLECRYEKACDQIRAGNYSAAREALGELGELEYADSAELCTKLDAQGILSQIRYTPVGHTFTLGTYEQDGVERDGKEAIEWLVIRDEGDRLLALSVYCLDSILADNTVEDVTWSNCSARAFLNGEFFENAFTPEEKVLIPESLIDNSESNFYFDTPGGPDTMDHVFFLSYDELNAARAEPEFGMWEFDAKPTKYAKKAGAATGNFGTCWWWLRTRGKNVRYFMYVDFNSVARNIGFDATHPHSGMRPAIWVDLSGKILD